MSSILQSNPGGVSPDEYLLKVANLRTKSFAALRGTKSLRSKVMRAQRSQDDLSLYLEGTAALPDDGDSTNVIIFTVPSGRDVIITAVRNTWSGNGFVNGSGDLVWSYILGGGFMMNRGNVTFSNTNSNGWQLVGSGGVYAYENQQIIIACTAGPNASSNLSGGVLEAQVEGWYVPKS